MTEANRDNLSACVDGELSREELRFLLRRLDHDTSLLETWSRQHVARDSLRRELPLLASPGFSARVMQAIEQEAGRQGLPVVAGRRRHWLHWSAGGAIAAGVAVAALMVAQPVGNGADRAAALTASAAGGSHAQVAAASLRGSAPAVVPPWLNANPSAAEFSQRASITLDPSDGALSPYDARSLSPYRQLPRDRTINEGNGSYLLLITPEPSAASGHARQAATAQ